MSRAAIDLYTTTLCPDCWRVKTVLHKLGAPFREIDILTDPEGGEEMVRHSGQRYVPTLIFPDGSILVEPDNLTLLAHLAPQLEQGTGEIHNTNEESA
ncbi:MAG: NrdH-redoxin [Chloroflexota bacterium]|nr:glutathione S-transferase N-terminal domain-containing protein [Caldilinea sp.]GIK73856.1 MAG: NrdH-redoxin [Chloroflexota bacterium]